MGVARNEEEWYPSRESAKLNIIIIIIRGVREEKMKGKIGGK